MDTKEVIKNYWDYRCEYYSNGIVEQSEEERESWKKLLSAAVGDCGKLRVLDVGTGPGIIAMMFVEMGHEVTAIDLSQVMLDQARKNAAARSLSIDFRQGDAENLDLPDKTFDVVVSKFLLWTLPNPGRAMAEWKRVLKDGGTMLAIDGDWFDSGLSSRAIRATSDAIRVIKERHFPYRQKKMYDSIRKDLPLYSLKPDKVTLFLGAAGFSEISVKQMDDLCGSARKRGSLLDKLDYAHPIYFIKAKRPGMSGDQINKM